VSCDGSVVVGVSDTPIGAEAFRWTNATGMVGIGELPGGDSFSRATGVSYDGNVIVGFSSSGPQGGVYEAFLWTAATGTMIGLGDVPGVPIGSYVSEATGISGNSTDASNAVVTGRGTGPEAFGWTLQSGMFGLGVDVPGPYPTGAHSWGGAISADGHAIVGYWQYPSQPLLETRAMLWDQLVGMVDLKTTMDPAQTPSLTGWTLIHADGTSADGSVITGWGKNPMDEEEAFIALEVVASKPIDFEKTQSHIICCWQPPGPDPWIRVFDGSASGTTPECAPS
jgi:probable HAF family extracellular repeat protein